MTSIDGTVLEIVFRNEEKRMDSCCCLILTAR